MEKKRFYLICAQGAAAVLVVILCAVTALGGRKEAVPGIVPSAEVTVQTTVPVETTVPERKSTVNPEDWNMILVNPWNYLPEDFTVELEAIENGHKVDKRIAAQLEAMLRAAREEGLEPLIVSSYRTMEKQDSLHNNRIKRFMEEGLDLDEAIIEAGKWVAVPGTSEHQTGLAVDIVAESFPVLEAEQENTPEQKWLMENSWKFGFIMRYPNDKSELTGIYYEPWHYRYVGGEAAKEIYEAGICFEEYLESLAQNVGEGH